MGVESLSSGCEQDRLLPWPRSKAAGPRPAGPSDLQALCPLGTGPKGQEPAGTQASQCSGRVSPFRKALRCLCARCFQAWDVILMKDS